MATTQGMLLDHLALVASVDCIPGSHGTLAIRNMVLGRLLLPGRCTDNGLRHTPKSFCNGVFFVLELWPEE